MKIGIFRGSDGACDLYRTLNPVYALERQRLVSSAEIWMANIMHEVEQNTNGFRDVMSSDIYLIQRISGQLLMKKIKEFITESKLKSKIVIDHDDDVFTLSPLDTNYKFNGTKEAKIFFTKVNYSTSGKMA